MTELNELLKFNKEALDRSEPDFYALLMSTYELGTSNRTVDELIELLERYLSKEELLNWRLMVFIDMLVETVDTFDIQKQPFKDFVSTYMNDNTLGLSYARLAALIRDNQKVKDYCTIAKGNSNYIEKRYN